MYLLGCTINLLCKGIPPQGVSYYYCMMIINWFLMHSVQISVLMITSMNWWFTRTFLYYRPEIIPMARLQLHSSAYTVIDSCFLHHAWAKYSLIFAHYSNNYSSRIYLPHYSRESYLLFLKMKYEYDQNVYIHFGMQTSAGLHENFVFIVSSEAKETFSTPKKWSTTSYLSCLLKCFLHLITDSCQMTQSFLF